MAFRLFYSPEMTPPPPPLLNIKWEIKISALSRREGKKIGISRGWRGGDQGPPSYSALLKRNLSLFNDYSSKDRTIYIKHSLEWVKKSSLLFNDEKLLLFKRIFVTLRPVFRHGFLRHGGFCGPFFGGISWRATKCLGVCVLFALLKARFSCSKGSGFCDWIVFIILVNNKQKLFKGTVSPVRYISSSFLISYTFIVRLFL